MYISNWYVLIFNGGELNTMLVQTHNGTFHADEVFACALLKICFKNEKIEIVRTRDKNINADIHIDVGGKFDGISYFDHHFKEFDEYHIKCTLPKASFGLIWDRFSYLLNQNTEVLDRIKQTIVIPIDAHDNGVKPFNNKNVKLDYRPYTVSAMVSAYNNKTLDENVQFNKAVAFAIEVLENIITNAELTFKEEQFLIQTFDEQIQNRYIILDNYYNYSNIIKYDRYSHITHIIHPNTSGGWCAICTSNKGQLKAPFPKHWGGLADDVLSDIAQIKGCIFCHKNLYFAVNQTKEGVIAMIKSCFN